MTYATTIPSSSFFLGRGGGSGGAGFVKTHSVENICYRTGIITVCRRVRAPFSPDILQAGAVKGLIGASEQNLAGDTRV